MTPRSWRITVKLFRPGWCVSLRSVMSERFTTSPQDVTAVPGQTVRLSCSIAAVPPVNISWIKDSLPLSRSPSDQHRYQPPQPFLLVALHFNGSFPVGPGLAGTRTSPFWILVKLRRRGVVTTGAIRRAKLQLNRHHRQTYTQLFTGRMSFLSPKLTQPTMSEH